MILYNKPAYKVTACMKTYIILRILCMYVTYSMFPIYMKSGIFHLIDINKVPLWTNNTSFSYWLLFFLIVKKNYFHTFSFLVAESIAFTTMINLFQNMVMWLTHSHISPHIPCYIWMGSYLWMLSVLVYDQIQD